jgi:hypothetical protein
VPSYVLGGALAADPATNAADLARYQSETVFVGSMAFLSAYIWVIVSLIGRINNFDTNPITFYFLAARMLTACLVAGIAHHILAVIPIAEGFTTLIGRPVLLAALGFLIGWNPSLWTAEIVRWTAKVWRSGLPRQRWPREDDMPQVMPVSLIEGLVDDKAERLRELDIDSCQKLACENAVLLWLRTAYNMEIIVDWIAQAQLCVRFEPDKILVLRSNGIRDIFVYHEQIGKPPSLTAVQVLVKIPKEILEGHVSNIDQDPAYQRLMELRSALQVRAAPDEPRVQAVRAA